MKEIKQLWILVVGKPAVRLQQCMLCFYPTRVTGLSKYAANMVSVFMFQGLGTSTQRPEPKSGYRLSKITKITTAKILNSTPEMAMIIFEFLMALVFCDRNDF